MALDKEIAQGIIDDFVFSNDDDLNRISGENKALFNATINALDFLSKKFGTGQKMKIVEKAVVESDTFKVGDKFKINKENAKDVYEVIDISGERISFKDEKGKVYADLYTTTESNKKLKEGDWVRIKDIAIKELPPFKVGDKFKSMGDRIVVIKDIIEVSGEKEFRIFDVENDLPYLELNYAELQEMISSEVWERVEELPFKVGDRFTVSDTQLNFFIDFIKATEIGIVYDDGLTSVMSLDMFKDGLNSGYYIPTIKQTSFKEGDLLALNSTGQIREVKSINSAGTVKLVFTNLTFNSFAPEIEKSIENGDMIKLPFKIGDTFVNKYGDTSTIEGLNVMQAGYVDVIHDNSTKETYDYKKIVESIKDGSWTKISGTVKTQKIPAPQVVTASGTAPKSAKLPKKTLSKEEKAIKALEIDIDSLSLIADFDDEAKAELEKKQAEIKALKSKIS